MGLKWGNHQHGVMSAFSNIINLVKFCDSIYVFRSVKSPLKIVRLTRVFLQGHLLKPSQPTKSQEAYILNRTSIK
jgi:hypothetical protein